MRKTIENLVREPLLHFLVIGGMLYAYFDMTQQNPALPKTKEIDLLSYDVQRFGKRSGIEENALVIEYMKYQKALLEDAYALGLDKDDASIRQTLLNKRESILNANAKLPEPDQKELQRYYADHLKDFSKLLRFDMRVKKFARSADVKMIKKLALFGDIDKAQNIETHVEIDPDTVSKKYGKYVALKIASIPQEYWSEPITLQDGIYLFYVSNKQTGKAYPFEDVESEVYRHYLFTQRVQALKKAYSELLKNYTFKVER